MTEVAYNPTENDERQHLDQVRTGIRTELERSSEKVGDSFTDVVELKQYLQDSKADMDHVEKISVRQSIEQMTMVGEHRLERNRQLSRLLKTPYFGRLDFRGHARPHIRPIYVGIHSFHDSDTGRHLVHDWRAPVSGMFYDFEVGPAHFDAPEGRTEGELTLKRQYRIENGRMAFMLETSLNIHDDLLQEELSRTSSEKMRNIVATIQRDQNAIIRNDHAHTLIIQGAAGSGKTSIALHRIAYLLYKFKDSIQSDDVLIISPNRVFGHYISDVLPELGEKAIQETTMETLAAHLLDHRVAFQSFYDQVATLLHKGGAKYAERVRFKATSDFVRKIEEYAHYVKTHNLTPASVAVGRHTVEADRVEELFRKAASQSYAEQISQVTEALVTRAQSQWGVTVTGTERTRLRNQLMKMFWCTDIKKLYADFFDWMGAHDMFKKGKGSVYEYADVYPLIYLGILLEGVTPHDRVKHLVIDEMQDYTPVQYRVLDRLFPCKKTVLGDRYQSVNPHSASHAEAIRGIFRDAECMVMNKSYRSTLQILDLAQHIQSNPDLIPIERHGDMPEIVACRDAAHEVEMLRDRVRAFLASDHRSFGILCKTQDDADALHEQLKELDARIRLLNAKSTLFSNGVIITTVHLSKGLEFDQVHVPHGTKSQYRTEMDRHLLYVACTRAMHRLCITHTGPLTPFLKNAPVKTG